MLRLLFPLCLSLAACGPEFPDLDGRIGAAARAAPPPELEPLGPLIRRADAPPPRRAEAEGRALEARAADLRRRGTALRARHP